MSLLIWFDDQSTMNVKTAGVPHIFPPGGKIKAQEREPRGFVQRCHSLVKLVLVLGPHMLIR
jgi:hypothetical protein